MGFFSRDISSLDDLFVHGLQDIYYAENQITQALPDMIDKASNAELKRGFEQHLQETRNQIQRLERVFQMHGAEIKGVDCPAIDGIIEEANEIAGEVDDKNVLDERLRRRSSGKPGRGKGHRPEAYHDGRKPRQHGSRRLKESF
jgi:ferritin-like metal-binding protein YciE